MDHNSFSQRLSENSIKFASVLPSEQHLKMSTASKLATLFSRMNQDVNEDQGKEDPNWYMEDWQETIVSLV